MEKQNTLLGKIRARKGSGRRRREGIGWGGCQQEADFTKTPRTHSQLWKTQPLLLPA